MRDMRSWNAITTPASATATMSLVLRPRVRERFRDTSGFERNRFFDRNFSAIARGGGSAKSFCGALAFSGFGFSIFGLSSLSFSGFGLSGGGDFFATTGCGGEAGGLLDCGSFSASTKSRRLPFGPGASGGGGTGPIAIASAARCASSLRRSTSVFSLNRWMMRGFSGSGASNAARQAATDFGRLSTASAKACCMASRNEAR